MKENKVVVMNVPIMTVPGLYEMREISLDMAKRIWRNAIGKRSAIGHEATAQLLSMLFDDDIKVNRVAYKQSVGEKAICLKMKGRIPEGTVLKEISQLEEIGYNLFLVVREQ